MELRQGNARTQYEDHSISPASNPKFLRNCWYVACWSDELSSGELSARTICNDPIVIWRDDAGEPHALHDRCPHRFAALSLGRLQDGALACGYHGLAFAHDGRCVHNPHGPILRSLKVRSYPVHERYRAVWIWMGELELADPSSIPDLPYLEHVPDTAYSSGYLLADADYLLYVDNLLDPTHADFLHRDTIGVGTLTGTKPKVEEQANAVTLSWRIENGEPLPLWVRLGVFQAGETADRRMTIRWFAPSVITVEDSYTAARTDALPVTSHTCHFLTPETPSSTHYFFSAVRNYATEDSELSHTFGEMRKDIFQMEDIPMIASQQRHLGSADIADLNPILLSSDIGAIRARRILERLIAQGCRATAND